MPTFLVSVDILVEAEDAVKALKEVHHDLEEYPITRVNVQKTTLEVT